jgi:LmbE family N-acetylglucosaminyl deacetylase
MKRLVLLSMVSFFLLPLHGVEKHTVLAIFAHPDDETFIGGMLAKYAAEGHDVYLALTTSGQMGNANTDIPKGELLGAAREEEARCSCKALGIHEPFLLGFMDGDTAANREAAMEIPRRLREIINQVKPDVIITWGPDGLNGHPDHRVAASLVTEVFQQRSLLAHHPRRLYYVACPESRFKDAPFPFNRPGFIRTVSDEFVTTEVDVGRYLDKAYKSIQCHRTQFTEERMRQNDMLGREVFGGKVFLRLVLTSLPFPAEKETNIF